LELLIQTLTNMLILAALYILVGLGFAFLFNVLGIFNIAHSSIYMVSGYLGYLFIGALGLNQWLGFALVVIIISAFGIFLEKFCFRPFIGDFNRQIMVCVALIAFLTTTVNIAIGSQKFVIPSLVKGILDAGQYSVSWDRILTFGIGSITLVAILLFIKYTRWGQQMQAITQNREGASLTGINIKRISASVCALGCGLAAIAGVLVGSMYSLDPFMGQSTLVKILMLVILAGVGSFEGIFIVGLILGILYAGLPILLPGAFSDAVAVIIVCIILLFLPRGFFGHEM
jgi:branched-chain amino acid transport system permease protein